MNSARPQSRNCHDFDRFSLFELEQIIKVEPAITFFYGFDRFCHFELEEIIKVDPAITFFNDSDRFCHFELQQISKAPEGQGTQPGPPYGPKHRAFGTSKNPSRQSLIGEICQAN